MKTQFLTVMTALFVSCSSFAETDISTTTPRSPNTDLKPLSGVRVSMQRMVKSSEGRYFLSLYAGIAQPHAVLYDLMEGTEIQFKGTQKGDQLNLRSIPSNDATNTDNLAKEYNLL